jgi:flagellar biosynthesis protein FlhB
MMNEPATRPSQPFENIIPHIGKIAILSFLGWLIVSVSDWFLSRWTMVNPTEIFSTRHVALIVALPAVSQARTFIIKNGRSFHGMEVAVFACAAVLLALFWQLLLSVFVLAALRLPFSLEQLERLTSNQGIGFELFGNCVIGFVVAILSVILVQYIITRPKPWKR